MQKLFIFFNSAQQHFTNDISLLILAYNFFDCFCVLRPHLMSDEGRVCKDKIKVVMILLWYVFGMIEVILKEIGIIFSEIRVELDVIDVTSKRKIGFQWFGLSMAKQMLGVERKQPRYELMAWLARKRIVLSEYQYWLKSPFSLFFSKNILTFFYIDLNYNLIIIKAIITINRYNTIKILA